MDNLKLYVWTEFSFDTDCLAFAIAEDITEAIKLIEKEKGYEINQKGNVYPLNRKIAKKIKNINKDITKRNGIKDYEKMWNKLKNEIEKIVNKENRDSSINLNNLSYLIEMIENEI